MNTAQLLDFPRWLVQTHVSRLPLECAQRQRQRSLVGNGVEQPQRLRSFDFDSFARATPQLPARQWTRSSRLDRSQISGPVVRGPLFLSLSLSALAPRSFNRGGFVEIVLLESHTRKGSSPFLFSFLLLFFSTRFNYPATSFVSAVAADLLRFLDVDPSTEEEHEFSQGEHVVYSRFKATDSRSNLLAFCQASFSSGIRDKDGCV